MDWWWTFPRTLWKNIESKEYLNIIKRNALLQIIHQTVISQSVWTGICTHDGPSFSWKNRYHATDYWQWSVTLFEGTDGGAYMILPRAECAASTQPESATKQRMCAQSHASSLRLKRTHRNRALVDNSAWGSASRPQQPPAQTSTHGTSNKHTGGTVHQNEHRSKLINNSRC